MNDELREAVAAYRLEDPLSVEDTDEQIAETIGFRIFKGVWDANRIADDLVSRGLPKTAEAFRSEMIAASLEVRKMLDDARDGALREWGIIP